MFWICLAEPFMLQGNISLSRHSREVLDCGLGLLCKPTKAVLKHCWPRAILKLVQCLKREWLSRQSRMVLGCTPMRHAGLEKIVLASLNCHLSAPSSTRGYVRVSSEISGGYKTHLTHQKTSCTKYFAALVRLLVFSVLLRLALLDYNFAVSCRWHTPFWPPALLWSVLDKLEGIWDNFSFVLTAQDPWEAFWQWTGVSTSVWLHIQG